MYIPRRRKARLKMGLMIAISSLSIGALAASTMAWYSVNTSITVNSSTVSIRTALQYHFYAYKDNGFNVNGNDHTAWRSGSGYKDTTPANRYGALATYYTEVDELAHYQNRDARDAYINALTKVAGLWPGYKMSFAVRIDGLQSADQPSLKLISANIKKGIADGSDVIGVTRHTVSAESSTYITMADAIMITAGSGDELQAAVQAADRVANGYEITPGTNYRNYSVDVVDENTVIVDIDENWYTQDRILGTAANTPKTSWWYFFTVEFCNDSSTYYIDHSTYYEKNTSGNSSCYEGLPFALGTMDLK